MSDNKDQINDGENQPDTTEETALGFNKLADDTQDDATEAEVREFHRLMFPEQSIAALGESLTNEFTILGKDEYVRQLLKIGTYTELLKRMIDAHTDFTTFMQGALANIKDPGKVGDSYEYKPSEDDTGGKGFSLKNLVAKPDKTVRDIEVSGHQARMLILASNHNAKRIYLYNSGFSIVLRAPDLGEINLVYNRLAEDMDEYGKMMGAIFYMYSDFKIKSILWEFVESLVIGSTLNKWDKGNRLRDNVSLLDYQHILLSIGTLMYKNGYEFVHVCTNAVCKLKHTEQIDLSQLQLTDFSRIPQEYLAGLASGKPVTPDDVRAYKKLINGDSFIMIGQYRIHRKVPSMTSYITHGLNFNDELAMSTQDIKDPKIIDQYLKYYYSKLFAPWIRYIASMVPDTDSNPEVSFRTSEPASIDLILNNIQNSGDRNTFTEKMDDYIQKAIITNIGYLATACPSCKAMPTGTINGFVPFDAQNSFFTMLVMQLIQTS